MTLKRFFVYGILAAAATGYADSDNEFPAQQGWDAGRALRLESAAYWTGPVNPEEITLTEESGKNTIEARLSIEPGHSVRIEKNFVAACHRGFRNMMAFGMVDEELSPYKILTFQYKTDIGRIKQITFRLYDRQGGWMEWQMPPSEVVNGWIPVTLSIPPKAWPAFNLHRWGGMVWEIAAGDKPLNGLFCLSDLQVLTECRQGLEGTVRRPPQVNPQRPLNPPPVRQPHTDKTFHLIMNMTGEIGHAMAAHQTEAAIQRLADAVAVFKGIEGLEYFVMPEAWFVKKFPTEEEVLSGKHPDTAEWLKKVQTTYVAMADWFEKRNIPFYVGICHSADHQPLIPAEIVQACIAAAPKTCRGALMGEFSIESNGGIDDTLETMRLLKRHGLKMLYFQQSSYWFGILMPAGDEFRQKLMAPEFKDVLVPMGEYVVPSAQGLAWATLAGLQQGGLVNDWGLSAQSWGYANMNWGGTSDQPGSYWLRQFLTAAALGGRYIEIEPKWAFDGENVPGQIEHFKQWAHNLRWVGQRRAQVDIDLDPSDPMRALILFNRLIREKALIPAAGSRQVVSISPVVFQVEHTSKWGQWDFFHRAIDKNFYDMCCPNYSEMSAQVPPQDAFSYLFGSNHFYDQTFPVMDDGAVSILPVEAAVHTSQTVFRTDGRDVFADGKKHTAKEAKPIIKSMFEAAADTMMFSVKGCTWSAIEVGKDDYLVVMMDPEERFPVGVSTSLEVRLAGSWKALDGMTGQPLTAQGRQVPVLIEPAGFRLIRIAANP